MAIPSDVHPAGHYTKKSRLLFLGYQMYHGKEYGQVGFGGPGCVFGGPEGIGGVQSAVMPWNEAEELFKFLENKINKTLEPK